MFKYFTPQLKLEFRFLFAINLFGILMVLLRDVFAGGHYFYFLWFNVFLASIPYGITLLMQLKPGLKTGLVFWPLAFIWLLILPNAPYIVTDLMHLSYTPNRTLWYDALTILTFAVSGLIFGLLSVHAMARILTEKLGHKNALIAISLILFACAFGVYLGRFQRFNSWDILWHPDDLFADIAGRIFHPFQHLRTWGMTLLVGLFLHILYFGSLALRQSRLNGHV